MELHDSQTGEWFELNKAVCVLVASWYSVNYEMRGNIAQTVRDLMLSGF
jgi:hypothetical protein